MCNPWSIQSLLVFLLQWLRFDWSHEHVTMISHRITSELGDYESDFPNNGNEKMDCREEEEKEISQSEGRLVINH